MHWVVIELWMGAGRSYNPVLEHRQCDSSYYVCCVHTNKQVNKVETECQVIAALFTH